MTGWQEGQRESYGRRYPPGRRYAVDQRPIWTCRNVSTSFIKVVRDAAGKIVRENGRSIVVVGLRVQESPFTEIPSIIAGCTAIGRSPERTTRRARAVARPTALHAIDSARIPNTLLRNPLRRVVTKLKYFGNREFLWDLRFKIW